MPLPTHGRCLRCQRDVALHFEYGRFRRAARLYLLFPLMLLPAFPFFAGDYVVSLPIVMVYLMGVGPVLRVIGEPPTCVDCGANVDLRAARPVSPA